MRPLSLFAPFRANEERVRVRGSNLKNKRLPLTSCRRHAYSMALSPLSAGMGRGKNLTLLSFLYCLKKAADQPSVLNTGRAFDA